MSVILKLILDISELHMKSKKVKKNLGGDLPLKLSKKGDLLFKLSKGGDLKKESSKPCCRSKKLN